MIEAKIGKEVGCVVQASGNVKEIAEDVLNLISAIYQDLRSRDPVDSMLFRIVLVGCVSDPKCPVWNDTVTAAEPQDGGTEE